MDNKVVAPLPLEERLMDAKRKAIIFNIIGLIICIVCGALIYYCFKKYGGDTDDSVMFIITPFVFGIIIGALLIVCPWLFCLSIIIKHK